MLLVCEQCGFKDSIMLKMPSSMIILDEDKIIFDNSSTDCYINLCRNCIGFFQKEH